MSNTTVVIAAYNEDDNIFAVVTSARRFGEVVVVDDASTDRTAELAEQAGAAVVKHTRNMHIKQAFVDGFKKALESDGEYVIQMDAGLSHDPNEIPRLLDALQEADMVIGSRFVQGGRLINQPPQRRLLSRAGSLLVRAVTGMRIGDLTSGFKGYRRAVLEALNERGMLDQLRARAFAFQFELTNQISRMGFGIQEVPITYTATRSSLKTGVVLESLRICFRLAHSG